MDKAIRLLTKACTTISSPLGEKKYPPEASGLLILLDPDDRNGFLEIGTATLSTEAGIFRSHTSEDVLTIQAMPKVDQRNGKCFLRLVKWFASDDDFPADEHQTSGCSS